MSNDLKTIIIILILIAVVIVGAVLASWFYFAPQERMAGGSQLESPPLDSPPANSQQEFAEIRDRLLQDEQFNELKKEGEWPLQLENIIKEKENPFDKVESAGVTP